MKRVNYDWVLTSFPQLFTCHETTQLYLHHLWHSIRYRHFIRSNSPEMRIRLTAADEQETLLRTNQLSSLYIDWDTSYYAQKGLN